MTLVGRGFVIWGKDAEPECQGVVASQIDETHYLVKFFEWLDGQPSTMKIFDVAQMTGGPGAQRESGVFEFFEDTEHLRLFLDRRR